MLFLISLFIAAVVAFLLDKPLKKHPAVFYVAAAVMTVVSIIVKQSGIAISNTIFKDYVLAILTRGALGTGFWAIVMWAGALPNGSYAIKKLMPIRGELSITAAILTLSHVVTFGMQYISDIARDRMGTGSAYRDFVIVGIAAVIMVLIMVPLTVMSFKAVRRRMDAKTWKNLQRTAYVFYGLIYIHLMVIFVPKAQSGKEGFFLNVLVYTAVFVGYASMRLRKLFILKQKPSVKTAPNVVCACGIIVPICLLAFISRNTNHNEVIKASKETPATFVFEAPTSSTTVSDVTTVLSAETSSSGTSTNVSSGTTIAASDTSSTDSQQTTTTVTTDAENEEETQPDITAENIEDKTPDETSAVEAPTKNATDEKTTKAVEPVTKPPVQETTAEEKPSYQFKNGTFEGTGEGYAGTVHVTITIENDYITGFSAYADDDDPDYFSDAMQKVIPQIQKSMSADVDACSGATYSSKGIMEAARNALEKAKN